MKAPVSILCISDLHFNNTELEPVRQLGKDLLSYTNNNESVSCKKWVPDYIVIAGDITNQGNKDYSEPKRHIDGLLDEFNLDKKRVIMVPGNHDKDTSNYKLTTYKDECDLFDRYQKNESKAVVEEFRKHFISSFSDYLSFANKFYSDDVSNAGEYHLYKNPELLVSSEECDDDNKAKLLSGVRFFEEDSLCFFLVNTEWLYVPPKTLMKENITLGSLSNTNNYFDEVKQFLSIKENCKLCVPLINDAFNLLKDDKYLNCTVVTIMHRDFKDLTWIENNHTDPSQKDPISQIEAVSDIILTGHEHSVRIEHPNFVKNKIQHFHIGSTGRELPNNEEPIRTACVLNINPTSEKIELLNASYDGIKNEWNFVECERSFPLRQKYCQDDRTKKNERVTIKAKSMDEKNIESEIADYFEIEADSNIVLRPIRYHVDTIKEELEKTYQNREKDKALFVVIYRIITNKDNKSVDTDDIKQFKENHLMDFLCNKLMIDVIDILVPNLVFLC